MNQTSLVGRPLAALTAAVVNFAERRGVWSGPLTSSSPELARLWASPKSSTGVGVSEETALDYSPFWACVNNISTDVASLPLMLYKREPNGGKVALTDHKLYRLLHDQPNPEMSSMTFRETIQAHILTWGNGYAEIIRDGQDRPVQLWPLTPNRVSVRRETYPPYNLYYEVSRADGGMDRLASRDMFHIPGLGFDGLLGYSVVAKARESIGLGLATERFGGTFFGNGSSFGGVISLGPGDQLTAVAQKNFRESIESTHLGVERAHKFLLLGNQAKYERLGIPPNDAQFLETRLHQVEEICRWFRMPPHKIQHLLRSTNNNIEHQGIEYYSDTLRGWCVRWEKAILMKLIAPSERLIQYAEHKIEGALRGDLQSRYAAYAVGRNWGWLSANDVRALENMNPLPKGGDIYLVPQNMAPADRIDDIITAQIAPKPAPVAPAAPAAPANRADDAAQMADAIRAALVDVETRIAETTAKITTAEADALRWKDSAGAYEAELVIHRANLTAAQEDANRLKAVLLEATERADRLALEQEALKSNVTAAEERVTAANEVIAKTAEQFETARAATLVLDGECANLKTACVAATAQAEKLTADHTAAVLALQTAAESDRAAAEQRVVELRTAVTQAEQQRDTHQATLLTLQAALADAKTQAVTLSGELDTLRTQATAATQEADAAKLVAAQAIAETAAIRTSTAQTVSEQTAQVEAERKSRADMEATLAEVRASAAAASSLAETTKTAAEIATAEALALRTAAEQAVTAHAAQLAIEQTEKAALQAEMDKRTQAFAAHRRALRSAHRHQITDVVARLIWKETERARKNQGTPEKLKAWADGFYLLLEETYVDALRSVLRAHLVQIGSPMDVDAYTRAKVHPHLLAALTQLRTVCDGDPSDFHVTLERLLTRWVADRPAALADLVAQDDVETDEYLRSHAEPAPAPTAPQIHIHNHPGGSGGSKSVKFTRNVDGSVGSASIEDD